MGAIVGGNMRIIVVFVSWIGFFSIIIGDLAGVIRITSGEFYDRKINVREALAFSFKSIFKMARFIICFLIIMIPLVTIFYLIFNYLSASRIEISTAFFSEMWYSVLFYILYLALPLIILGYLTPFIFSFQEAFIEKKTVLASLKGSYQLVKNNLFKTLGYVIVAILIGAAIYLSLQMFSGMISGLFFLSFRLFNIHMDFTSIYSIVSIIISIPLIVIYLLVYNIPWIIFTVLYFNRRNQLKGYDLLQETIKLKDKGKEE